MVTDAGWQSGASPTGVLPREALLGRDRDADELRARCEEARLVTLLGPGGVGKTSLVAWVAPEIAGAVGTTAWWVDLQPLEDGERIAAAIADALGMTVTGGGSAAAAQLAAALGDRDVLLVLDNCEHVAEDVAATLDVLLPSCRRLRILTTSREVIGVAGERVVRLPSLALPPPGSVPDADVLRTHAATSLFLDRAGLDPTTLDLEALDAVASICHHVDGLPLAIELAAARSPALSPVEIEAALENRFRLLTSRRRTVADRQRTLEASIAWSYELLDDVEQQLLRSVAVFPAGFDLTGAAIVGADHDEPRALDLLTGLIDKSLVAVQERPSGRRYRLLESVRAFADRELVRCEEFEAARERHLTATRHRLAALQRAADHEGLILLGVPWLDDEFDDLRAAASTAARTARPNVVIDLWWAVHVWAYAHYRPSGPWEAAIGIDPDDLDDVHRLRRDTMLAHGPGPAGVAGDTTSGARAVARLWDGETPDADMPLTAFFARLWHTAARAWAFADDHDQTSADARLLAEVARGHREEWGDLAVATAAVVGSRPLAYITHPDEALALAVEGAAAAERIGSPFLTATCHLRAGEAAARMGLSSTAVEHMDRALSAVPAGWDHLSAWMATTAGHLVAISVGELERTERAIDRYGDRAGAVGSPVWIAVAVARLSILLAYDRVEEAYEQARVASDVVEEAGSQFFAPLAHSDRARALARLGRTDEALALARRTHASVSAGTDTAVRCYVAVALIEVLLAAGEPDHALAEARDVISVAVERLHVAMLPWVAIQTATALVALERSEDAARTLGVLQGELDARNADLWSWWKQQRDVSLDACRTAIGEDATATALDSGRQLAWGEWSAWLTRSTGARSSDRRTSGWAGLTDTEIEVARRAAEGLSNAELAEVLFVSINTVKTHLKHIYAKLDVHSRVELVAVVDQHR